MISVLAEEDKLLIHRSESIDGFVEPLSAPSHASLIAERDIIVEILFTCSFSHIHMEGTLTEQLTLDMGFVLGQLRLANVPEEGTSKTPNEH